ncbi:MAG: STAS domain-containing protein [Roseiflexaceae bacterium]
MPHAVRHWLSDLPFTDPLEYRQARLLQVLLLGVLVVIALDLISLQITSDSPISQVVFSAIGLIVEIFMAYALFVLRRGRLRRAAVLAVMTLLLMVAVALTGTGLRESSILLAGLVLPVGLAGVLFGRRGIWITSGLALTIALAVGLLSQMHSPLVGYLPSTNRISDSLVIIGLVLVLMALFLDRFSSGFRDVLATMQAREGELDALRQSLEETVATRTAALQTALVEVQTHAEEQERLLHENEQQRATIRELSVPIIPITATTLIMPLVGALDGERLQSLQTQALHAIERSSARTLILDITGVPIVDSQVAEGILSVVQATRLLGAETVLVGIRPEVAQAIVGLGLSLPGLRTSSTLQAILAPRAIS